MAPLIPDPFFFNTHEHARTHPTRAQTLKQVVENPDQLVM